MKQRQREKNDTGRERESELVAAGGNQMSNVRLLMCVTLILCHFVCVRQAEKNKASENKRVI